MTREPTAAKHVLIVDDEPDFTALLRSIVENAGYTAATAHKCEDALKQARKHRPDIVTLDIHMPRKSGVFFYHKFKSDEANRNIPVIVVTALTRDREMGRLIRNFLEQDNLPHPEAYLEKPIDGPSLLKTIQKALSSNTRAKR